MSEVSPPNMRQLGCALVYSLIGAGFTVGILSQQDATIVMFVGEFVGALWGFSSILLFYEIHRRHPLPKKMAALAEEIHSRVYYLVDEGYTRLIPRDVDQETLYLRLVMDGETAVIERHELARKVVRAYRISADNTVKLCIRGAHLLAEDREWYQSPLTLRRLTYLHRVVHGKADYSPRRASSRSS